MSNASNFDQLRPRHWHEGLVVSGDSLMDIIPLAVGALNRQLQDYLHWFVGPDNPYPVEAYERQPYLDCNGAWRRNRVSVMPKESRFMNVRRRLEELRTLEVSGKRSYQFYGRYGKIQFVVGPSQAFDGTSASVSWSALIEMHSTAGNFIRQIDCQMIAKPALGRNKQGMTGTPRVWCAFKAALAQDSKHQFQEWVQQSRFRYWAATRDLAGRALPESKRLHALSLRDFE